MDKTSPIPALQKQAELLRLEMHYEQEAYSRSLNQTHYIAQIQEPSCRYPVTLGKITYNALDQMVLTVTFDVSDDEPDTDFEPGTTSKKQAPASSPLPSPIAPPSSLSSPTANTTSSASS